MPLFGAHMSIAGGCHNALLLAEHGCDTVQLFTKNANQWKARPFTEDDVRLFRKALREAACGLPRPTIRTSSTWPRRMKRCIAARSRRLSSKWQRAEQLGLSYLVTHPGAHVDSGEEAGLTRVAAGPGRSPRTLSGLQGPGAPRNHGRPGHDVSAIASSTWRAILSPVAEPDRLGVCFDTCHVFAAGYPLAPARTTRRR